MGSEIAPESAARLRSSAVRVGPGPGMSSMASVASSRAGGMSSKESAAEWACNKASTRRLNAMSPPQAESR